MDFLNFIYMRSKRWEFYANVPYFKEFLQTNFYITVLKNDYFP